MLSLPPPDSWYIIQPTLNELSRLLITETKAAFSLSNGRFQLAVLSIIIRTFGRSEGMFGLLRNRSVSSLTGSNTAYGVALNAASAIAASRVSSFFIAMLRESLRDL